jgi:hypothetical protein
MVGPFELGNQLLLGTGNVKDANGTIRRSSGQSLAVVIELSIVLEEGEYKRRGVKWHSQRKKLEKNAHNHVLVTRFKRHSGRLREDQRKNK